MDTEMFRVLKALPAGERRAACDKILETVALILEEDFSRGHTSCGQCPRLDCPSKVFPAQN